jgi:hypothetical protein
MFISDAVDRILRSDNTIDRFEVDVSDEDFECICSLMEGKLIVMTEDNYRSLRKIAQKIENEELVRKCTEFGVGAEAISVANCVERLKTKEEFGLSMEEEIAFVASHFYGISEELHGLRQETVEGILSHEKLCLRDEDSLVEFLGSLGEEYRSLFAYVECRFLTLTGIETFLGRIDETAVNQRLWSSICRRLRCELSSRMIWDDRFCIRDFPYREGHKLQEELQGIIHALTVRAGGNVHEKGVIEISGSGNCYENYESMPFVVANHQTEERWASENSPNSWIRFDFKNRRIGLSHYTLRSRYDTDQHHLMAWVVEGRNDDREKWVTLDERNTSDTRDLVGRGKMKTYECRSVDKSKAFRYIQVRLTEKDSSNRYFVVLSAVEFFGDLRDSPQI